MKKGFTLIELLIVIAILAILTTTVVLVLNPAQMLAEARDSQRLSDLDAVRSAISLYLATATTPVLTTGRFAQGTTTDCLSLTTGGSCSPRNDYSVTASTTNWIGIDLSGTSGGSPLAALPRDPSNTATLHYAYGGVDSAKTFELNARLESTKYNSIMLNDGGNSTSTYEIGTAPGLAL